MRGLIDIICGLAMIAGGMAWASNPDAAAGALERARSSIGVRVADASTSFSGVPGASATSTSSTPASTPAFGAPAPALALPAKGVDGMVTTDPLGSVTPAEWAAWRAAFLTPDGRVVDGLAGNISHSEGQGYGMLLAYAAGDRVSFELIWSFTRLKMALRDDRLIAWRWDPTAHSNVSDPNNATDGDILIAYALSLAGAGWAVPAYAQEGVDLVRAIRAAAVVTGESGGARGKTLILPGVAGFAAADRPGDGPVVNPSYWVFEAFPAFGKLDADGRWGAVARSGMSLLSPEATRPTGLPSDWVSLKASPRPAEGFQPVFGYNALRVPLYLVRAGVRDPELLGRLEAGLNQRQAPGGAGFPIVDVSTGAVTESPADPGYRAVRELLSCAVRGDQVSPEVAAFAPTTYYPSTLHLLVLSYLRKELPQCL